IGSDRAALDAMNPHPVPLVAHDRTGFGGGVATMGLLGLGGSLFAPWTRALWGGPGVGGLLGVGAGVGGHGVGGCPDAGPVGPAVGGAVVFLVGMLLSRPRAGAAGAVRRADQSTPAPARTEAPGPS